MSRARRRFSVQVGFVALMMLCPFLDYAQYGPGEGHSIGSVTTRGNLIVLTLDEDALARSNLFNLEHRTLRFTPDGAGYRVENLRLQWDSDFGPEMTGSQTALKNFAFPFSGRSWNSFSVGMTGSMTFGQPASDGGRRGAGNGHPDGGISVDRFAELRQAAPRLINTLPAISVFFKPRMSGKWYLKELGDHVVVTWSLTEPVGGVQDMTWMPTVNRFQAVLRKDGTIELSYDDVAAKDAIVGVYPMVTGGRGKADRDDFGWGAERRKYCRGSQSGNQEREADGGGWAVAEGNH